jgi:glutamate-1-semialdehyde aminotransferase
VGDQLAVVVVEPLIVVEPLREWLETVRDETARVGAVLVFDEIKTAFRLAVGGVAERTGIHPDLVVLGKAMANGFPLAAVGGRADLMEGVGRTWISSTLATEAVALAAARVTLDTMISEDVCGHLHAVGTRLLHGLHTLQHRHPHVISGVGGVAEMCFFHFVDEHVSRAVARGCAARGLLFKRTAYNFVSLAHGEGTVDESLALLEEVLHDVGR